MAFTKDTLPEVFKVVTFANDTLPEFFKLVTFTNDTLPEVYKSDLYQGHFARGLQENDFN